MPITVVADNDAWANASLNVSVPVPGAAEEGDLIIAVGRANSTVQSPHSGWTRLAEWDNLPSGYQSVWIDYMFAPSSVPSDYTATTDDNGASQRWCSGLFVVRGADSSALLGISSVSTETFEAPDINVPENDSLLLRFWSHVGSYIDPPPETYDYVVQAGSDATSAGRPYATIAARVSDSGFAGTSMASASSGAAIQAHFSVYVESVSVEAPDTPTNLQLNQQGEDVQITWSSPASEFLIERERWDEVMAATSSVSSIPEPIESPSDYQEVMQNMESAWLSAWNAETQAAADNFYSTWPGYQSLGLTLSDLSRTFGGVITINSTWLDNNQDGNHIYFANNRWYIERVQFTGRVTITQNNVTMRGFRINRGTNTGGDAHSNLTISGASNVVAEFGEVRCSFGQNQATEGGHGVRVFGSNNVVRALDIHTTGRTGLTVTGGSTAEYIWVHDMLVRPSGSQVGCSIRNTNNHVRRNYFQDGNHSAWGLYAHDGASFINNTMENNLCNMQRTETQAAWGLLGGGGTPTGTPSGNKFRYNRFGVKWHPRTGTQGTNRHSSLFTDPTHVANGNEWCDNTWLTGDQYNGYIVEPNPGGDGSTGPYPSGSPAPGTSNWEGCS